MRWALLVWTSIVHPHYDDGGGHGNNRIFFIDNDHHEDKCIYLVFLGLDLVVLGQICVQVTQLMIYEATILRKLSRWRCRGSVLCGRSPPRLFGRQVWPLRPQHYHWGHKSVFSCMSTCRFHECTGHGCHVIMAMMATFTMFFLWSLIPGSMRRQLTSCLLWFWSDPC